MGALIWQSDHTHEAHACAADMNGHAGPSVFDIQKVGEAVTVYDYVNSQPFDTRHLKTVAQAKDACDLRYKEWLERMGLVSVEVQGEELVLGHVSNFWRTLSQIEGTMRSNAAGIPVERVKRALTSLVRAGRIEEKTNAVDNGGSVYRLVLR